MRTVITHFYNEEYLLPRWLEHHKKYFDYGILINYDSTDNSVAICNEICPNWPVMWSAHRDFDARLCDEEVMWYERQIPGWRIALTVTEFLVGDLNKLMNDKNERQQWLIPGIRFTAWDPEGSVDPIKPLWEQFSTGISYHTNLFAHGARSLHNFSDIDYKMSDGGGVAAGRHFPKYNTEDALIFHYAHCIVGEPMLKRRLQVQTRVSESDKMLNIGNHHYMDANGMDLNGLHLMHTTWIVNGASDCTADIQRLTKPSDIKVSTLL